MRRFARHNDRGQSGQRAMLAHNWESELRLDVLLMSHQAADSFRGFLHRFSGGTVLLNWLSRTGIGPGLWTSPKSVQSGLVLGLFVVLGPDF